MRVRVVEAQPVRRDERARLPDVLPEDLPQRRVEQVRARVVAAASGPPGRVDACLGGLARGNRPLGDLAAVHDRAAELLRVGHDEAPRGRHDLAAVADLSAALGVERAARQHHLAALPCLEALDDATVRHDGRDDRVGRERVVADELA